MMKNLSSMGRSLPRLESVEKAVGAAKYTVDMALPGMLHGKIFRSPYAHARILKVDVSKAAGLPGVRAILTGQELAKISKPYGPVVRDEMGLQSEKVRYVGDEVAAVAAVSEEIAEEALHLIDVEYEELPALLDPEVALQLGAPQIHEGVERNKVWSAHIGVGDVEQGFKEADRVFKRRFVTSKVTATPPEPHAALASYNRYTGELTIWTSSQCIFYTRLELATSLGLSEHKVRAVAPAIGGGFGHKVDGMYSTDLCAAVLSMRTGCPVKIVLTREEETMATRTRHSTIRDVEVGVKNDGTIIAYCEKTIVDNGAYTSFGPGVAQLTEATAPGPYKIPNLHLHADLVYTNKAPGGAFRGFGNPQATFARESILDEIAERLGVDRIQFRLKNAVDPSDLPYVTPLGYELQTCGVKDCIERSAAAIGWEEKSQDKKPNHGLGLATMISWSGSRWQGAPDADFSSAYVRVNEDGSATVYTGISDMGQGIYTALAQVAAEELGILPENVGVVGGDTETTPMCLGAWGSRGAPIAGSAVKIAAADAKQRLFAVAAAKLEAAVEDLESEGGKIYVKGSLERALSVGEVAGAAHFTTTDGAAGSILGRGFWDAPTEVLGEKGGHYAPAYAFAAAAAEVEVDPETGQVRLLSFTSAHDVAQAINPMIVEGQIQGGAAQGIGYGLFEEMVYDQESGRLLNPSFVDYKVPTAMDLPRIVPVIVEPGPDPAVPAGVKGVGEAGYICAAGAIANAVSDAVGVRISELPITSERIYNALVGKRQ